MYGWWRTERNGNYKTTVALEARMKWHVSATLAVLFLAVGIGLSQEPAYQPGKIVSMHKRERASPMGGTDAATNRPEDTYDVSIETGGKTYETVYHSHSDLDPTWAQGKDVEVQVKGKTMYVKRSTGKPTKLAILK